VTSQTAEANFNQFDDFGIGNTEVTSTTEYKKEDITETKPISNDQFEFKVTLSN
jgi:hypothetical protein